MLRIDTKRKPTQVFLLLYETFTHFKTEKSPIIRKFIAFSTIADSLFYEATRKRKQKNDLAVTEGLSVLLEIFIFQARIYLDHSLSLIKASSSKKLAKSYSDFTKKINEYGLSNELISNIQNTKYLFIELKEIRDSIKQNHFVEIYIKDKEYRAKIHYDSRSERKYKTIDEDLGVLVLKYSLYINIINKTILNNNHIK